MLVEKIRRRMKGIIWFIVISFTISIFFIGAASFLENRSYQEQQAQQRQRSAEAAPQVDPEFNVLSSKPLAVVKMNGTSSTITEGQLNRMLIATQMVERLRNIPKSYRSMMTDQFLQELISNELMVIEASRHKIDVSGKVTARLGSLMSSNGGQERFTQQIKRNGWSGIEELRAYLNKDYVVDEVKSKLFQTIEVPDEDIESYYALYKSSKYKDSEGNIKPLESVKEEIRNLLSEKVSDQDLKSYYNNHKDRWRSPRVVDIESLVIKRYEPSKKEELLASIKDEDEKSYFMSNQDSYLAPEKVDLKHLYLDKKELARTIKVSDDEVKKYYKDNSIEFTMEKMVKASHVLIDTKNRNESEALKKAERILAQIRKGDVAFEQAAKTHSDGPSGPNGGSLGSFRQGDMVPAFDAYCFNKETKLLQVSEPIKTKFGYHLVRLEERMEAHTKPLDQVRDRIIEDVQDKKVQEVADQQLDVIDAELRAQISTFDELIAKYSLGASKVNSGLIEGVFLGEGNDPEKIKDLSTGADSLDMPILVTLRTLKDREISEAVETSNGWHLVQLLRKQAPKVRAFEDVKDKVRKALEEQKLEDFYKERVSELSSKLTSDVDFSALVKTFSDSSGGRESAGAVKNLKLAADNSFKDSDAWVLEDLGMGQTLHNKVLARLKYLASGGISSPIDLGDRTVLLKVTAEEALSYESFDLVKEEVRQAITLKVTEAEIATYFNENRSKYATPAEVLIQQIAYRTKEDAEMQLKSIKDGLMQFDAAGKSRLNVDRSNFEKNGGTHPLAEVGFDAQIGSEIEQLQPGQILPKLAKSPFGWHVVRLKSKKEAKEPSLADAKVSIMNELKNRKRYEVIQAYSEELRNRAEAIEIF